MHRFTRRLKANRTWIKTALALYVVQFSNYALQLATIPLLARRLGPDGWGSLAVAQAFALYLSLLIGYGFDFSGSREIAICPDCTQRHAELFAGISCAKIMLAILGSLMGIAVYSWVPTLAHQPVLVASAVAWGVTVGLTPNWYFLGKERMRLVATLDAVGKAITSVAIFFFVRSRHDGWKMLAVQSVCCGVGILITSRQVYRELPFCFPRWEFVKQALQMGWMMFIYRTSGTLNAVGNAMVLSFFALPAQVGYYSAGEKIYKAFVFALWPLTQALYPRLSRLYQDDGPGAARLLRLSFFITVGLGLSFGAIAMLFAPVLIRLLMGPGFQPAIPILRIFAILLPLTCINFILGIQCMVPVGLDRAYSVVTVLGSVVNLGLALLLGPHFGYFGMAWALVGGEAFAVLGFYICLRRAQCQPLAVILGKSVRLRIPPMAITGVAQQELPL
jgi:PST family polysaccharide transporter